MVSSKFTYAMPPMTWNSRAVSEGVRMVLEIYRNAWSLDLGEY